MVAAVAATSGWDLLRWLVGLVVAGIVGGWITHMWRIQQDRDKGEVDTSKDLSKKAQASALTDAQQTEQIRNNESKLDRLESRVDGFDDRHSHDLESLRRAGGTDQADKDTLLQLQGEVRALRDALTYQRSLTLALVESRGRGGGDVNVQALAQAPTVEESGKQLEQPEGAEE